MRLQRLPYGIVISITLMSTLAWAIDDGQPQNGLSSEAFRRNALTTNKKALEILSSHALNDALLTDHGGYIARQLQDPNAQAVMTEIVKCALDDQTTLGPWKGEAGLCQDWRERAPTQTCQQLVTACVMARVNAMQKAIPLWLRGYPSEYSSSGPVVTVKVLRESILGTDPAQGIPIPGFGSVCGPDRECNWKAGYVGKCRPGDPIALRLDAQPSDGWEVRVCAGIHGCIAPTNTPPGGSWPPYSWRIGEFSQPPVGNNSLLAFSCPIGTLTGGYYSVMTRNEARPDGVPPALRANSGVYPAPRHDVFRFLEGAFFGNLFLADKLTRDCEVSVGQRDQAAQMTCRSVGSKDVTEVCKIDCGITSCRRDAGALPYSNVHACYSIAQQEDSKNGNLGVAYLNSRICDRPDATCFPEPPGPCTGDGPESARCTWLAATGKFADCTSTGDHPEEFPPVTTYLNEPCDLIGEGALCDQVRSAYGTKPPRCWTPLCVAGGIVLALFVAGVLAWCLRRRVQPRKD
jgi:hypothetical protein